MDIAAAKAFDRLRDFAAYAQADLVGAARWIVGVMDAASAQSAALAPVQACFAAPFTAAQEPEIKTKLATQQALLLKIGSILTTPLGAFGAAELGALEWTLPQVLPVPMVKGQVRVEAASEAFKNVLRDTSTPPGSKPLEKMITLQAAGRKWALRCANDPLECMAADLSVFEGAYDVTVRAWPDQDGRLFVLEAAPVMNFPGLSAADCAQGRLFDNQDVNAPVVLRVDKQRQITLPTAIQDELRPFVGTGVILYGKRKTDPQSGQVSIDSVYPDYWVLTRLTDGKDDANHLDQAPLPSLQREGSLCIGGTPPWNWQGPNVRTHMLCPNTALGIIRTTERRFVFGHALKALPDWVQNTYPEIKRILQVSDMTERDTDGEAHWATRMAPVAPIVQDLGAVAHLTSAAALITP